MKKLLLFITAIFICGAAIAQTIRWHIGDTVYQTTTCNAGESITPPTAPDRFGYHLKEWEVLYTQIEYLESTGTQWIDTGIYPNDNLGCDVGYLISSFDNGWHTILAARDGSNIRQFSINYNTSDKFFIEKTASGDAGRVWFTTTPGQYSEVSLKQNVVTLPNRTTTTIHSTGSFIGERSIYIFAFNTNIGVNEYGSLKLYYLKLYDNNTLVREFIPVLDKNGTPCMYDKVEGKFYYNQGTGQFIAGPVIGGE